MDRSAITSQLIGDLSIKMWEPPLVGRWRARSLQPSAMTVLLILAFETEVQMEGLSGFLEGGTGEFLPDITRAFQDIGASQTAQLLERVASVMTKHGVTHEQLRADLEGLPELSIVTFSSSHDESACRMAEELRPIAEQLFTSGAGSEPVHALLEVYVASHELDLASLLAS